MKFSVYGLRLRGDLETRYVGMTYQLKRRVQSHFAKAKNGGDPLSLWLAANRSNIECFRIAETEDREVAKATERTVITVCVAVGQRLFNLAHMPGASDGQRAAA